MSVLNVKYKWEICCVEEMMLYHQAALAVGGERIRLRELCLKMGRACLNKNPYYPCLKLPRFVLVQGKDRETDKRQDNLAIVPVCCQTKGCQTSALLSGLTSIFGPHFLYTFSQFGVFVSVCACLLRDIVFTRSFCACALTLSRKIKGWTASGQVIQSTDNKRSSVWKFTAAQLQRQS